MCPDKGDQVKHLQPDIMKNKAEGTNTLKFRKDHSTNSG